MISTSATTPRSFVVTLGLPGGQLLVLENLPVVDSPLVEHLRAAQVADLRLGVPVRRVTLRGRGAGKRGGNVGMYVR